MKVRLNRGKNKEVVISRFINAGTFNNYCNIYIGLTEINENGNICTTYDYLNFREGDWEEIMEILSFIKGDDYSEESLETFVGTKLRVELTFEEINNHRVPMIKYLERLSFSKDTLAMESFDIETDAGNEELIDSLPEFIQKRIRNSDEYKDYNVNKENY